MHVITLNDDDFRKACISLADRMMRAGEFDVLVGVRTGGAVVAKIVRERITEQGKGVRYFEAGASRYATGAKQDSRIKMLFSLLPQFLLDAMRIAEHYAVCLRMRFVKDVDRSVKLDDDLVNHVRQMGEGKVFIVDDAIDSGGTVKRVLEELKRINPAIEYLVAVLVVTQNAPVVIPEVSLYRNLLLRFPWSSDYKT